MTYNFPYRWGPSEVSPAIRWLIAITASASILSALFDSFLLFLSASYSFYYIPVQNILALSWWGISKFYIWQPLTYLFIEVPARGLDPFYFLGLALSMYFLWILGSGVQQRLGTVKTLYLYFLSGIISGIVAVLVMRITGQYQFIAGPTSALMGLFTAWTMIYAESEMLLFFLIPIKAKWLYAGVLGALGLSALSQFNLVLLFLYFTACLFAYVYGSVVLGLSTPFTLFSSLDHYLQQFKAKWEVKDGNAKIYDFKSGQPVMDDDAFIDAMLAKIAKGGMSSLSASEQRRMEQISKRRRK